MEKRLITADGNEVQNEEGGIEVEEVERAVRKLKSGKAGGVCSIQVEMVKAGGCIVVQWLKDVFDIAWKRGKIPHEWRDANRCTKILHHLHLLHFLTIYFHIAHILLSSNPHYPCLLPVCLHFPLLQPTNEFLHIML